MVNTVSGALRALQATLPAWLAGLVILAAAAFLTFFLHAAAVAVLRWILGGRVSEFGQKLLQRITPPTRLGLLIVVLGIVLPSTPLSGSAKDLIQWFLLLGFVAVVGWTAVVIVDTAADLYMARVPMEAEDQLLARKHLTQVRLLRRIAVIVIGFITFAALLMTVPSVRQYGVSLFASAGVAGLVVGLAARPLLSNLIAGVQIAVTQPIRIDDGVQVEGEFGTVEEIRTTYVVIRLWDWRRLVVPLSYFMEKPFQNWTRESMALLGTVFWQVDYTVPIADMRTQFLEVVRSSPLWDGQVAQLQVTDVTQHGVQLRGLVSAASASASWDLRCEVREKMLGWLQENHPGALPKERTVYVAPGPDQPASGLLSQRGQGQFSAPEERDPQRFPHPTAE